MLPPFVIPANAGIHNSAHWMPAYAGMTEYHWDAGLRRHDGVSWDAGLRRHDDLIKLFFNR